MIDVLFRFLRTERGAVTVDWVTVSASLLLLGIAIVYSVYAYGVTPAVSDVNGTLNGDLAEVPLGSPPSF